MLTRYAATFRDMSTTALAQHGRASRYYALVAGASFCLGAGMELFMVRGTTVSSSIGRGSIGGL